MKPTLSSKAIPAWLTFTWINVHLKEIYTQEPVMRSSIFLPIIHLNRVKYWSKSQKVCPAESQLQELKHLTTPFIKLIPGFLESTSPISQYILVLTQQIHQSKLQHLIIFNILCRQIFPNCLSATRYNNIRTRTRHERFCQGRH